MKRKLPWIVLVAVVVLTVAVFIWLRGNDALHSTSSEGDKQSALPPAGPPPDLSKYEQALNGADKNTQVALLLPEFRSADWSAADVVPEGMTLRVDPQSFKASGVVGSVSASFVTPNEVVVREFAIYLEYRDNTWLIRNFEGT